MSKYDYLQNDLQRELFQKVSNLLLDMPRRLTKEDAELALCQAWSRSFHQSLGRYVMIQQEELKEMYNVLAVGSTPQEALEAWIKHDPWARDEIHSYRIDNSSLRSNGKNWRLEFTAGPDRLIAEGIYTIGKASVGGAVMTKWGTNDLISVDKVKALFPAE